MEKRFKEMVDGTSSPSKTQTATPSAPTQTSLGPLRIIKPIGTYTKGNDAVIHSLDNAQFTFTELLSPYLHEPADSCASCYEVPGQNLYDNAAVSSSGTAVGDDTFHFTETPWSPVIEGSSSYENTNVPTNTVKSSKTLDFGPSENPLPPGIDTVYQISSSDNQSNQDDAYPLDDGIADDNIIQLLANPSGFVHENHIPPSSVQEWHCQSRSPIDFDPTLQHTPPDLQAVDSEAVKRESVSPTKQIKALEDLLDEDVDWSAVLVEVNTMHRNTSNASHINMDPSQPAETKTCTEFEQDIAVQEEERPLATFVRPPFPEAIHDRPFVPGMSSETLLRTCFRVGVMIEQTARCFNHQQDVLFQLYARVTYSSRETQIRRQHFQFVDLFKDINPYPSATFSGWRAGSQMDRDSAAFLDTSGGPRLCWCMCKPIRDKRTSIGWTYKILKIREVDWDEIRWAKTIVCEYAGEQQEEAATGR